MKKFLSYSLLAAAAAAGVSFAETATTPPVGYVSLGAEGSVAVPANSEVTLAVPLFKPAVATQLVSSVSGSTITVQGSLTAGAFNTPANAAPYLVEIVSGQLSGLHGLVTSNTANTITLSLGGGDTITQLQLGDKLVIREAWTLETLLASSSMPDGVQLAAFDVQNGVDNSSSSLFLKNSLFGGWINGANFSPAAHTVLYPGESFILINNTSTPIPSIVVAGEVPLSKSRIRLYKDNATTAQDTRIGYVSPVSQVLNDAGFVPAEGDQLLVYSQNATGVDKSASQILIFNTLFGGWIDGSNFSPVGATFKLQGGMGYVYRRAASAPVGDQVISNQQSYISGL